MLEINRKPLTLGRASKTSPTHRRKEAKRALMDARRERLAIEQILKLPSPGESLHFVSNGRFEPCDLIPATRRLSDPQHFKSLYVCTLGFNTDNVATLTAGIDQGKVDNLTVVCSNYFKRMDREIFAYAKQEIESRGGRIFGLNVHAKIMLMEMTDDINFHVIEGSGNLRSCDSIEQFAMINDRTLLNFHRTWIEDAIQAGADEKPKRVRKSKE